MSYDINFCGLLILTQGRITSICVGQRFHPVGGVDGLLDALLDKSTSARDLILACEHDRRSSKQKDENENRCEVLKVHLISSSTTKLQRF